VVDGGDPIEQVSPPERCSLEEYLRAFDVTIALLQTREALARAAYELCEDAAQENVIYTEIRFAPLYHIAEGLKPRDVVLAALDGLRQAEEAHGIKAGLILSAIKQDSTESSLEVAQLAAQFAGRGVVGFDLAGPERLYPPLLHRQAIDFVHAAGVPLTIHAGEGCCPEQIREAVDLGADRIGHGVYLLRDPGTEQRIAQKQIPLEMCPTSNLQISGFIQKYSDHPIKRYFDLGIPVTINTDNRLMSKIDLTHEYECIAEAFDFSREQVRQLVYHAVDAAFAPDEIKGELRTRVDAYFASL